MKVFGLTTGADTAGINIAIRRAFGRHSPDWDVRSMVASGNYIGYPVDVPFDQQALEELYDAADVVHLHNTTHAHEWYDAGQGKPTVLMHHGRTGIKFGRWVEQGRSIGALQVGSTLDLAILEPKTVRWLPPPIDLAAMRRLRAEHYRPGERIRVGHAPTNPAIKGTAAFRAAMAGIDAEMVLIQGMSWQDCLVRKATCDVFFDQPALGYGMNAVESWAMGIPVIAGVEDQFIRRGMIARWGQLPFAEADEGTLGVILRAFVKHAAIRLEYARKGTEHVERWHDERVTVETLQGIYAEARPTLPGGNTRRFYTRLPSRKASWAVRRAAIARARA